MRTQRLHNVEHALYELRGYLDPSYLEGEVDSEIGGFNHLVLPTKPVVSLETPTLDNRGDDKKRALKYGEKTEYKKKMFEVAVLINKTKNPEFLRAQSIAIETLRKKNIQSPFIKSFQVHSKMAKISKRADMNLAEFLKRVDKGEIKQTQLNVKECVAQILQAVKELHINNVGHRDITPENCLITCEENDAIHLELADLDTVTEHPDLFFPVNHEGYYIGREMSSTNYKAKDCYALGITLSKILEVSDDHQTRHLLQDLIRNLTRRDKDERFTIQDALQHPIFGDTPVKRDTYFKELHKKFSRPDIFYDSYAQVDAYPRENDAFLLLPSLLKQIYQKSYDLHDGIQILKQSQDPDLVPFIREKALTLIKLIEETCTSQVNYPKKIIETLLQEAIQTLADPLFLVSQEMITKVDRPSERKEQLKPEFKPRIAEPLSWVTSEMMVERVNQGVKEYILMNNLDKPSSHFLDFFRKHNYSGKKQAMEFQTRINALKNPSPYDLFMEIERFFQTSKNGWNEKSFKTILAKKLAIFSYRPFSEWPEYLSSKVSPSENKKFCA